MLKSCVKGKEMVNVMVVFYYHTTGKHLLWWLWEGLCGGSDVTMYIVLLVKSDSDQWKYISWQISTYPTNMCAVEEGRRNISSISSEGRENNVMKIEEKAVKCCAMLKKTALCAYNVKISFQGRKACHRQLSNSAASLSSLSPPQWRSSTYAREGEKKEEENLSEKKSMPPDCEGVTINISKREQKEKL